MIGSKTVSLNQDINVMLDHIYKNINYANVLVDFAIGYDFDTEDLELFHAYNNVIVFLLGNSENQLNALQKTLYEPVQNLIGNQNSQF